MTLGGRMSSIERPGFSNRCVLALFALLMASVALKADGYCGYTWGVKVTLKDGAEKSGYVSWCDGGSGGNAFDDFRSPQSKNHAWAVNFPRANEIPKVNCYECDDSVFLLWAEYAIWCGQNGHTPSFGDKLWLMGEIVNITKGVTATAIVSDAVSEVSISDIRAIALAPELSLRIDTCLPNFSRKQIEYLEGGKVLHTVSDEEDYADPARLYDPAVGPKEWLSSLCAKGSVESTYVIVDGHRIWGAHPGQERPAAYVPGDYPDTPMYRELAEIIKSKVWQSNHLSGKQDEYKKYSQEHFKALSKDQLESIVTVGVDCD